MLIFQLQCFYISAVAQIEMVTHHFLTLNVKFTVS